ncbi:DUF5985 family protein [Massilia antarctica]|uniref:DUF5985 family protein n=1 Tax=Massilia antarctica TaxID=2765360 RepID=UPI001E51C213|nr:DUF5985 family protein [Massilia antarctica]
MNLMLAGAGAMDSLGIGLFFLRLWRNAGDRFFLYFALFFLSEGGHRVYASLTPAMSEDSPFRFLLRLLSYCLILWAIAAKNWNRPHAGTDGKLNFRAWQASKQKIPTEGGMMPATPTDRQTTAAPSAIPGSASTNAPAPRSASLLPADGDEPDGRLAVAEEASVDQQSDSARQIGALPPGPMWPARWRTRWRRQISGNPWRRMAAWRGRTRSRADHQRRCATGFGPHPTGPVELAAVAVLLSSQAPRRDPT